MTRHRTASKVHKLCMTILLFSKKVLFHFTLFLNMCLLSFSSRFLTIAWIRFRVRAGRLVQQKSGYDDRVWV